jgi:PhnB protein
MSLTQIQPYLFFGGNAEEAITFYRSAIGAQTLMMMRFNESPDPAPEGMIQPGFENKIMHATLQVGEAILMVSDGGDDQSHFAGFRLSLAFASEPEAHAAFNALAEGGSIMMPLCKTFWSPCFGMLTDRFGVGWMVTLRT